MDPIIIIIITITTLPYYHIAITVTITITVTFTSTVVLADLGFFLKLFRFFFRKVIPRCVGCGLASLATRLRSLVASLTLACDGRFKSLLLVALPSASFLPPAILLLPTNWPVYLY